MEYSNDELDVWMNQQKLPVVSPKYVQGNRSERRSTESELSKIGRELINCESRFLEQLFEENGLSYVQLYQHYLKQYNDNIKACISIFKPKHVLINLYYFEKTYKPVV